MKKIFTILVIMVISIMLLLHNVRTHHVVVAIANYGPHSSLEDAMQGLKKQMEEQGFVVGKNIKYETADVGFDHTLIVQMLMQLKSHKPKVMVALSTPVAQIAKNKIKDIPIVYCAITDPVAVGLIEEKHRSTDNITGSSDMQDLGAMLSFAKNILPSVKAVGLLYATSDSNDAALVDMMRLAATTHNVNVVAIPIDNTRDIPIRMLEFKDKVDFLYVGTSGPIQPALPVIASVAKKMQLPVFNSDIQAVRNGIAFASFGVDYEAVGRNAGKLVGELLVGNSIRELPPIYPALQDHHGCINKKKADELGIKIPESLKNTEIIK